MYKKEVKSDNIKYNIPIECKWWRNINENGIEEIADLGSVNTVALQENRYEVRVIKWKKM